MRACLFDIDGTLLASGGAGKAAMDEALASEFGVTEPIAHVTMSGRTDRGIARDQFELHAIEATPENWRRFRDAYLRRLPASLARLEGRVLPGVESLLSQLAAAPVAVGLLTGNMSQGADTKLRHYGIDEYFSFGAYGDRHFTRDEVAEEALRLVSQHLEEEVDPAAVWVIGDTPLDVSCARAIGAKAFAVATGVFSYDELAAAGPDILLMDLSDPSPLLELLD